MPCTRQQSSPRSLNIDLQTFDMFHHIFVYRIFMIARMPTRVLSTFIAMCTCELTRLGGQTPQAGKACTDISCHCEW